MFTLTHVLYLFPDKLPSLGARRLSFTLRLLGAFFWFPFFRFPFFWHKNTSFTRSSCMGPQKSCPLLVGYRSSHFCGPLLFAKTLQQKPYWKGRFAEDAKVRRAAKQFFDQSMSCCI
jgi:hypothetical protein